VLARIILIEIEIVLSILYYVSSHKMPSGQAVNNLLIIFDNTKFPMDLKFDNILRNY